MKKILFDASIHLGQFSLHSEQLRILCKNSQVAISPKGEEKNIGVCTFNENSWVDHIIWGLAREAQDIFYPFMDVFHSVKDILRIPLLDIDIHLATQIQTDTKLTIAQALSCAGAVRMEVSEIHTLYASLLDPWVQKYMKSEFGISILVPKYTEEKRFTEENLEKHYQNALTFLKKNTIDLSKKEMSAEVMYFL